MSRSKVKPFITVNVFHEYYSKGLSPDFVLKPSRGTIHWMKKQGLFIKTGRSSIIIGYSETTRSFFEDFDGKIDLVFSLQNNDPYFQSKTEIPFYDPVKKIFYFDNQHDDQKLHGEISVVSADLMDYTNYGIEYTLEEGLTGLTLENRAGEEIWHQANLENESPKKVVSIDLRNEEQGYYTLKDGSTILNTYYLTKSAFENHFGVIHLLLDKSMLEAQEKSEKPVWNYSINFKNRKSKWRYYFLGFPENPKPFFEISHAKLNVNFSEPVIKNLKDGRVAWMMVSESELEIKEVYEDYFKLKFKKSEQDSKEHMLVLPAADATTLRGEIDGNKTIALSDIYVHLG